MTEEAQDVETGDVAPIPVVKNKDPVKPKKRKKKGEFRIRLNFVFWKTVISLLVSIIALWAIVEGIEGALETLENCYVIDISEIVDEDVNAALADEKKPFGLCNFRVVIFVFSVFLTFPLLSQSFLANMVFFSVITRGNIVSEAERQKFHYWLKTARSYVPCLYTYDPREDEIEGIDLMHHVLKKIARMTVGERARRLLLSFFGVFVWIPGIFIWRLFYRLGQTLFCCHRIVREEEYRESWSEGWRNLIILPLILLNDPISVMLLFPLAFVVIFSSQSVSETVVNLVAVQVFASLDTEFVELLFAPHVNIASMSQLYFPDFDGTINKMLLSNFKKRRNTLASNLSVFEPVNPVEQEVQTNDTL